MSILKRRPSPALVISMVALFVALGSGAYAASKITTKDIKKKAVTTPKIDGKAVSSQKIAGKAVTASKIARDSVKTAKLQDGTVTGSKIAEGAVGASALAPIIEVEETSPPAAVPPIDATASCPPGTTVTGGGFAVTGEAIPMSSQRTNNSWEATATAQNAGETVTAYAYCREDSNGNG